MSVQIRANKLSSLLKLVLCLIITLSLMLGIMVTLTIVAQITKTHFLLVMNGQANGVTPMEKARAMFLASLAQNVALVTGPVITALCIWKQSLKALGLTSLKCDWKDLVAGVLFGSMGITIAFCCLITSGSAKITDVTLEYTNEILVYLVAYIAVAFGEELLCRGGAMLALKGSENKMLILLVPSLLFGFMHLGNQGVTPLAIINLVGFGLYAAYCFYRSGNIWLPVGFHFAWNFVQGNIYGFHVSGIENYSVIQLDVQKENVFTGGAFGPEGGLGVTTALALLFFLAKFYYRKRTDSPFMVKKSECVAGGTGMVQN